MCQAFPDDSAKGFRVKILRGIGAYPAPLAGKITPIGQGENHEPRKKGFTASLPSLKPQNIGQVFSAQIHRDLEQRSRGNFSGQTGKKRENHFNP
jgi:hypothetical protein